MSDEVRKDAPNRFLWYDSLELYWGQVWNISKKTGEPQGFLVNLVDIDTDEDLLVWLRRHISSTIAPAWRFDYTFTISLDFWNMSPGEMKYWKMPRDPVPYVFQDTAFVGTPQKDEYGIIYEIATSIWNGMQDVIDDFQRRLGEYYKDIAEWLKFNRIEIMPKVFRSKREPFKTVRPPQDPQGRERRRRKELLTPEQLAIIARMSPTRIRELLRAGKIKAKFVERKWLIRVADAEVWLWSTGRVRKGKKIRLPKRMPKMPVKRIVRKPVKKKPVKRKPVKRIVRKPVKKKPAKKVVRRPVKKIVRKPVKKPVKKMVLRKPETFSEMIARMKARQKDVERRIREMKRRKKKK